MDYVLDVFLETFDGAAPAGPTVPTTGPGPGGGGTALPLPVPSTTKISSATIAIGSPIVFKVGTGGQLTRLRLINSYPVDIYLQMVYADSVAASIASNDILDEFLIPANTMVNLENLSGSFVYAQEFWARASTAHQSGNIINADNGQFLTGEMVKAPSGSVQGTNLSSPDILTAILAELKSWVLTRNY